MSRERDLLEALKQSNAAPELAADNFHRGAQVERVVSSSPGGWGMDGFFDFLNTMGASMAGDPMFYLKTGVLLILTLIILFYALDMIVGN